MSVEETANMLDLKRDYVYGRGVAVDRPLDREDTHLRDYWRIVRRRLWIRNATNVKTILTNSPELVKHKTPIFAGISPCRPRKS